MHRLLSTICCTTLIALGLSAFAQQTPPQTDPQGQAASKGVTYTGTVTTYEAGKTIEVGTTGGPKIYNLSSTDMTFSVRPDVKMGSLVKITETKDASGKATVTIEPAKAGDSKDR